MTTMPRVLRILTLLAMSTMPLLAADARGSTLYGIDGVRDMEHVTQSGKWRDDAVSVGGTTTFRLDAYAALTEHMLGWHVQPDVGCQVYLPITAVDPNNHTLTVAGNYASLGGEGTSFRIFAPPGVERRGLSSGLLSDRFVAAESSRCLYGGYRFESPLAGRADWTNIWPLEKRRQTGKNFAGQHYTLHRHYDPVLMRFTSPDPIAAQFWNLHHYAGNSPAVFFDPDGLDLWTMAVRAWHGDKLDKFSDEEIQSVAGTTGDVLRDIGEVTAGYAAGLADAVFLGDAVEGAYSALGVDTQGEMFQGGRTVGMVTSMVGGLATGGGAAVAAGTKLAGRAAVAGGKALVKGGKSTARDAVSKLKGLRAEARTPGTELSRLAARQAAPAGDGIQYALVARRSGSYPVMKRGSSVPVDSVSLKAGDVWKYGQTKNPGTRYSQKCLKDNNLRLDPQSEGLSLAHRRQIEKAQIDLYRFDHGRLPPGNKIRG